MKYQVATGTPRQQAFGGVQNLYQTTNAQMVSSAASKMTKTTDSQNLVKNSNQVSEMLNLMKPVRRSERERHNAAFNKTHQGNGFASDDQ